MWTPPLENPPKADFPVGVFLKYPKVRKLTQQSVKFGGAASPLILIYINHLTTIVVEFDRYHG